MITSITMTAFYALYYFYYRNETRKKNKALDVAILFLVVARIVLVLLPQTTLSIMHTHTLTLGFMITLFVATLLKNQDISPYKKAFTCWNMGLLLTLGLLFIRGIYQVLGEGKNLFPDAALSGMAGMGHFVLGIGILWVFLKITKNRREISTSIHM